MEYVQGMIWSQEELDIFAPRKKTKREINKEKKEAFEKKLLERVVLSDEEIEEYSFPLEKKDMVNFFNKIEIEIGRNYYMNPGVPKMVLTTLSNYFDKNQDELLVSDLIVFYNSFNNIFPDEIKGFKKFSKKNGLRFGLSQYAFMHKYMESLGV